MHCVIYKGPRKADTYLYVEREGDFERVPPSLLDLLGPLQKVMDLELSPDRRLAQADVDEVMAALRERGYYLQLPPGEAHSVN